MMNVSVTKLIGSIVRESSKGLKIEMFGRVVESPDVKYIFGNAQYIKDQLDEYSKGGMDKFPLVALFTPVREQRGEKGIQSRVRINILIACSTKKDFSNEEREETSFEKILRPIYDNLMIALKRNPLVRVDYDDGIEHEYSENYSYGRYGAYTESGEAVSEPIDAINISSMELSINKPSCR